MTSRQKRVIAAIAELELRSPGNEITPRALWESAREESHPLHDEFEWDDSVAAAAHRDEQARRLLRLRITTTIEDRIIRAPICVRSPDALKGEAGYTRTMSILDDKARAKRAFLEEADRVARIVERLQTLASAFGLEAQCAEILRELGEIRRAAAA
jgi:hypothetical protein